MLILTEALADSLAHAVGRGLPIETACAQAGIARDTWYQWQRIARDGAYSTGDPASPEMRRLALRTFDTLARVQAEHEAEMIAAIDEASRQQNEKTGIREWRAGAWMLEHHPRTRDRWGNQPQPAVTLQITAVQRQVRALSTEQLEQLLSANPAEPSGSPLDA